MPQTASVFCNFYIRVDREALVSERALDVGSVAFKAMSTKNLHGLVEIVSEAFTQITELFNCDIILFSIVIKMYALICNLC
jgi:hypothetical protein